MARAILKLRPRRFVRGLFLAAVAVALVAILADARAQALEDPGFLTGWALLGAVLFLAAYQVRKKLTYPPLMRSSTWLQLHIYTGLASGGVFILHAGLRWPTGFIETMLAVLYWATFVSGVCGLLISRAFPRRLTARGEQVIFERIPQFRRQLADEARQLALEAGRESGTSTLGEFYDRELAAFFFAPRNRLAHLMQSDAPAMRTRRRFEAMRRYLTAEEQTSADAIAALAEVKHGLDYQHAMQSVLKGWLFIHIPLTYMLLLAAAAHVFLVYRFGGD